jgi:hypothetical protein
MPSFGLKPCDESFFDRAPSRYVDSFEIPLPAGEVWGALTVEGSLDWCRMLGGAKWTSPRPFGVGTTRKMTAVFGALQISEYFFRWEDGRRYSFHAVSMNLPLFRRFAEDYLIEPTSPTSCRFTWTIAAEPTALGRPGVPINALLNRSLFQDTRRHFNTM